MINRLDQNVAQLVLDYGSERAREIVGPRYRALVDIANEVLTDERQQIGISYSGFCLTSLPHKRLSDSAVWQRKGHKVTLLVEPGVMRSKGRTVLYGVPFGARARMILLYLQTQAIRTNSREIELGRSMRTWMERMGIAIGGETTRALREQAARISACSLKFFWEGDGAEGWTRGGIVSSGLRFKSVVDDDDQGKLWDDRVVLDETFWRALKDHPVPLQEAAIRALAHRSLALDVYIWLAWRCHEIKGPTDISWISLDAQFNTTGRPLKYFKPLFTDALRAAMAAYPDCRLDVEDRGITLRPSRPPVLKLMT
ncbi:replication protein RepA [Acidiphilium cryptum]|uniref:Plasmid encoded RepA protein n=1 Tax=Acidiphilium cryptum (strain JF-5) TaxID=349163 RepID=A5FTW2_ACICJ|nr:replication protein RepA [Acidiphilium cryptum]ABQ29044.1 plasmid encoded RepA protein [Acidiphilium cryptum JF-5]